MEGFSFQIKQNPGHAFGDLVADNLSETVIPFIVQVPAGSGVRFGFHGKAVETCNAKARR